MLAPDREHGEQAGRNRQLREGAEQRIHHRFRFERHDQSLRELTQSAELAFGIQASPDLLVLEHVGHHDPRFVQHAFRSKQQRRKFYQCRDGAVSQRSDHALQRSDLAAAVGEPQGERVDGRGEG